MATQKTPPENLSRSINTTPCQSIQNQIDTTNGVLGDWQDKLNYLLSDTESDLDDIRTIQGIVESLNKELSNLKAEQRRLKCPTSEASELPQDNQTVISTSSVRKKDARAFEIIELSSSSQRK